VHEKSAGKFVSRPGILEAHDRLDPNEGDRHCRAKRQLYRQRQQAAAVADHDHGISDPELRGGIRPRFAVRLKDLAKKLNEPLGVGGDDPRGDCVRAGWLELGHVDSPVAEKRQELCPQMA